MHLRRSKKEWAQLHSRGTAGAGRCAEKRQGNANLAPIVAVKSQSSSCSCVVHTPWNGGHGKLPTRAHSSVREAVHKLLVIGLGFGLEGSG